MRSPGWRAVRTLAAKDWRLFWSDRRAAVLSFLVPAILASIFGLIFDRPRATNTGVRLPLIVVCETQTPLLARIVNDLATHHRVEAILANRTDAEALVADRRPGVAVVFLPAMDQLAEWSPTSENVVRPPLEILHNPLCQTEAQWAEGLVTEVIMRRIAREKLGAIVGEAMAAVVPFEAKPIAVTGNAHAGFNAYSHSFCGMTLQYLLFWGMESGLLLLRERNRAVWLRVRTAPVPFWAILLGRALATASVAVLQVLFTFLVGYLAFGVTVTGSVLGFFLLVVGISLLSAAIGLLVAAIGGTEARARSICIVAILGISMVGGLWLPSFLLPGWVRDLAQALPTTWAMRGLDGVTWQGRGLPASLGAFGVIIAFSAVFLAIAFVRLFRSERARKRGWAVS